MKLIEQQHIVYPYNFKQDPLINISEQIEMAGRTCYKSKRPEGKTPEDFVRMLVKNKHYAMLEHGTIYLHKESKTTIYYVFK